MKTTAEFVDDDAFKLSGKKQNFRTLYLGSWVPSTHQPL
jgi:hypothetical protein